MYPHRRCVGYPCPQPEELETPQVGGMARAQVHLFSSPFSDACRVHYRRYVFMCCPVRYTQPTNSLSVQAWHSLIQPGRDRYIPPSLGRTVNSKFYRLANGSSSLSRYAPPSSWPHVPVCQSTTTVASGYERFSQWSIPSASMEFTTRTAPCCMA